ncbi:MAG: family acetyltransferase [Planctomycetaceae bacterium]|nr:family acetyltransferase [Planctomycetaceae bacterium]
MTIPPPTKRLTFRDWSTTDLATFHAICSDPFVMEFVGTGEPWSLDKTQQFIDRAREMSETLGYCQWPLIHTGESKAIGFCGFIPAPDGVEIGWRLARQYWGQGLATEAARAVLKHGFETLRIQHIIATVQSSNRASLRIIKKLQMKADSSFLRYGREVLQFSLNTPQSPGQPS